ncbi:MAG: MBL fold metallo-hydrolase [Alphaproteobacteria bacterium]|nr:MAG: MBL fold metallo-hydrolase [Alphaproteobacteria bacterium]
MFADLRYPIETPPAPGKTIEVAPGIKWLQMPLPFALNHINLYLLDEGDGWTIVDTGICDEGVQKIWEDIFAGELDGKPVKRVIVTHMHPDHIGNAGWLCRRWGVELYTSRTEFYYARGLMADRSEGFQDDALRFYVRGGIDQKILDEIRQRGFGNYHTMTGTLPLGYRRLIDGETMTIGDRVWQIITGSGHSPEHVCLYNADLDILLSGDQVLPRITSNVSVHPMEPEENPMKYWLESHEKFKSIPATAFVLPSHNRPFYGLHDRLDYLIYHHEDRMDALEEACVEPKMAAELLGVLFKRELDSFQMMLALGECFAHLHCLMDRNKIVRTLDDNGMYRFQTVDAAKIDHHEHDKRDDAPIMV